MTDLFHLNNNQQDDNNQDILAVLAATVVPAKDSLAAWAGVSHLLEGWDTERNAEEAPETSDTENTGSSPDQPAKLLNCLGGDGLLALGADHGDGLATKCYKLLGCHDILLLFINPYVASCV